MLSLDLDLKLMEFNSVFKYSYILCVAMSARQEVLMLSLMDTGYKNGVVCVFFGFSYKAS